MGGQAPAGGGSLELNLFGFSFMMRIGNKLMQIAELIRFANVLKIRKGPLVIVRWIVDIIFLVNDL